MIHIEISEIRLYILVVKQILLMLKLLSPIPASFLKKSINP